MADEPSPEDDDNKRLDDVLRRLVNTPPKPMKKRVRSQSDVPVLGYGGTSEVSEDLRRMMRANSDALEALYQ